MKRLTRSDLASRVGPRPPSDAFWRRAIDRGEAALGVGPEAVAAVDGEDADDRADPLAPGDIVDVGDYAFAVVDAERTAAGGRTYRLDLIADREAE